MKVAIDYIPPPPPVEAEYRLMVKMTSTERITLIPMLRRISYKTEFERGILHALLEGLNVTGV